MLKTRKEVVRFTVIVIIIITVILIATLYIANKDFRGVVDKYVLWKEVDSGTAASVAIEGSGNNYVYAVENSIVILSGNTLKIYNGSGRETRKL